jgi:hypothetical protein
MSCRVSRSLAGAAGNLCMGERPKLATAVGQQMDDRRAAQWSRRFK